uniref:CUB domain-containing protein n=1 Tax=Anopheles atroparvus TaxID=41427 RepID=A0AAG5D7S6_ANOAO
MRKLIINSIIKFAVLSCLKAAIEPSLAGFAGPNEGGHPLTIGQEHSAGGAELFRMINEYDERQNQERYGAFTLTSDRRSVVECGGVYKRLQSDIRSPGYPAGYQGNLYCEYTFKSPFVCSSQYHFQFLEFALEPSRNCSKDRLAIGDEEVLCGTVIGAKLYDAPGGVLRMKFVTDSWGTARGFRILVTRQPCSDDNEAAESSTAYTVFTTIQVAEDEAANTEDLTTTTELPVVSPGEVKVVSSRQDIPPEFNPGGNGYLPPPTNVSPTYPTPTYPPGVYPPATVPCPAPCYPPWGCATPNYPYFPPAPPRGSCDPRYQSCPPVYPSYPSYPQTPSVTSPICPSSPCGPGQSGTPQYPPPYYPGYPSISGTEGTTSLGGPPPGYEPVKSEDRRPEFPEPTTERVEPESQVALVPGVPVPQACCRNTFTQRRFYLTSANFPSQITVNQDCVVQVQRFSPHTCRLVIGLKFFLLGNAQHPGCPGGFIEIDGQRICGCRTGQTYRTADFGPYATKTIRIYSRAGRFPMVQGFVLDVYQEDCPQQVPLKRSDTERLVEQPTRRASYEMGRVEGKLLSVPVQSVQTTNSTTRTSTQQVFYYNLDEAQPVVRPQESRIQLHYRPLEASEKFVQSLSYPSPGSGPNRCLFTVADWLRLKLDWLWLFKPVCLVQ